MNVHLIRHGRVASHRGDVPLSEDGFPEIEVAGLQLSDLLRSGEVVQLLSTPSTRSRQTAARLYATIRTSPAARGAASRLDLVRFPVPRDEWAIRNPDLFLAGRRVEMVSTPASMVGQIPDSGLAPDDVARNVFFRAFFSSADRIGYWLMHPDPPGEDTAAVARRIMAYCASLRDIPAPPARRFLCVTHSPVMRAMLVHYLGFDPGEPEWGEWIDIDLDEDGATVTFREHSSRVHREATT